MEAITRSALHHWNVETIHQRDEQLATEGVIRFIGALVLGALLLAGVFIPG